MSSVDAHCVRCREPLGPEGVCPKCEPDDFAVAEKLRRLRDEIARERGEAPPAEPRSRLWRRKKEALERKRAAASEDEAKAAAGSGEPGRASGAGDSPPPAAAGETASGGQAASPAPGGAGEAADGDQAADAVADADAAAAGSTADADAAADETARTAADSDAAADAGSTALPPEEPPPPDPVPPRRSAGARASGLRARELRVGDGGSEAVAELLEHRRKGLGRIIGVAGLPRHGKTKLADRLRERYAERPGADLRYDKTERGEVNVYYLPGHREHHVLVDVAGEDFQALGDYDREVPALMREFLWPVLQEVDGLLLLMALPIVWAGWNHPHRPLRQDPDEREEIAMRDATRRMVDAHRMLLKYAMVARSLERLRKRVPHLGLEPATAPTRNQVDDAFRSAARLDVPVAVAFSKADLYATASRPGLHTPDLPGTGGGAPPPPLDPARTDPLMLGNLHFPGFFDFLLERVRHFRFDFVQALEDRSAEPDPREAAEETDAPIETLLGAEALVEFVTAHPWRFPGLSTRTAVRLSRWLDRDRWGPGAVRRLNPGPGPDARTRATAATAAEGGER